ncbi:copper amine oxidase N-terminal domain-containing protein [Paenibacillus hodogayensis]|uniref:Copper amine oxidase N-terminal domain-containing protein n=1 Tax=Paenibacillus hodogayensis TaxID=279208 RepID=A0ABV5W5Z5_9BACL
MEKRNIWRYGRWLLLAALAAIVGCQSLGGLELNRALLAGMNTKSVQQSLSISLHVEPEAGKETDEYTKAMIDELNATKLELQSVKMESQERMSIKGQLTVQKGTVPFHILATPEQFLLKVDGVSRTIVVPVGFNSLSDSGSSDDLFQKMRKQVMAKYKEKGIDTSIASLIVNNLPNPKQIGVSSTTETIHNEQVSVYKLDASLTGSELLPLAKTFIRSLLKDEQAVKKLVGELYDVLWPVIEPYAKNGELANMLPLGTPMYGDPMGHVMESIIETASDKELAVDMIHTFIKQGLYFALIGVDSAQKTKEGPFGEVFNDNTKVSAKLSFDRNLDLRKSELEFSIRPQSGFDGVSSIKLNIRSESWDHNKPVKADALELGANPFVFERYNGFDGLLESADPNSIVGQWLAERQYDYPELLTLYIPVAASPEEATASDAYIEDGIAYAPVERIADFTGSSVEYDKDVVTVTDAWGTVIRLMVNDKQAEIDGESYEMDGTVRKHGDTVYVPCRFIVEELGASVWYDEYGGELSIWME